MVKTERRDGDYQTKFKRLYFEVVGMIRGAAVSELHFIRVFDNFPTLEKEQEQAACGLSNFQED